MPVLLVEQHLCKLFLRACLGHVLCLLSLLGWFLLLHRQACLRGGGRAHSRGQHALPKVVTSLVFVRLVVLYDLEARFALVAMHVEGVLRCLHLLALKLSGLNFSSLVKREHWRTCLVNDPLVCCLATLFG